MEGISFGTVLDKTTITHALIDNTERRGKIMTDILTQFHLAPSFQPTWARLTGNQQRLARKKLSILHSNPKHPSLRIHRLRRARGTWECYLTYELRLLYSQQKGKMCLLEIGKHEMVDRCHQRGYQSRRK